MTKNQNIKHIRVRYVAALSVIALLGIVYTTSSFLRNEESINLHTATEVVLELDRNSAQIATTATTLEQSNSNITSKTLIASLGHLLVKQNALKKKYENAAQSLSAEHREGLLKSSGMGGNVFRAQDLTAERIINLQRIAEVVASGGGNTFVNSNGEKRRFSIEAPYRDVARFVALPYPQAIKNSVERQLAYIQKIQLGIADTNRLMMHLFAIGGILCLCVVGYFIFKPMEKVIREQIEELELINREVNAADKAKSEFLANMSHEIRTPMNGVMGMAELLAKTELDPKQTMFTDVIVKSGASLLTIINDILDFSKIDAGQMELDPAPFSIAEAIEDVATLVSTRVAEKDLELIVRIDPSLPPMLIGDVGRVRQIVTNLMGNAVKFTDMGHVYVNVLPVDNDDPDLEDSNTQRLRISVEDTGIGIPEEDLQKVFQKFSQVDTSATRRHEGTGLGLSIASSLVNLMGGNFGVESEEGKGSTFWFEIELPIHGDHNKRKRVPHDVSGSRILIIDDNAVNRSILTEQMDAWKFDSAAANSGQEGLAVIRAALEQGMSIDCVVLDYHMPNMNGGQVMKVMRNEAQLVDIPVVMLTSVDETEDGRAFSSLGVQAHLTKPTRSSLLLETIIRVLQDDRAKRESETESMSAGIAMARQIGSRSTQDDEKIPATENYELPTHDTGAPAVIKQQEQLVSSFARPSGEPSQEIVATGEGSSEDLSVAGVVESIEFSKQASTPVRTGATGGLDILVCEDNEVNQILFTQILQETGMKYRIANNGKEGLSLYRSENPSLILMDVSMPKMNGLEATQAIREIESETGGHTPIIGVTAHAIKGDMEKCFEAGMDDYLSKPISPDTLISKIELWMNKTGSARNAV